MTARALGREVRVILIYGALVDCNDSLVYRSTLQNNVGPLCKSSVWRVCKLLIKRGGENEAPQTVVMQAHDSEGKCLVTTEPLVTFAGAHLNFNACKSMILRTIGRGERI